MRLVALIAAVLTFGSLVLAQQIKEPKVKIRPAPGTSVHHGVVPPPTANNSSANELAKIEQQTARVRTAKPVAHHPSAATTPALDLGKNKPVPVSRAPKPPNPAGH